MRTAHRSLLAAVALTAIVAAPALTAPLNVTISSFVVPGPAAGAQFGFAVESLGDVNFDGVPDSAVGAPGADVVRIYSGADGSVLHTIGDPDGESGTDFGWSLANVGDLTGDGLAEVAIGARGVDQFLPLPCLEPPCEVAPEQGRAFVYSARTGNLLRRLTPANSEFLAFGFAVAGPGDLSGDGVPDVVVGAPTRLNNRFGQVYAFSGANGAVLWVAKEANQALASFGSSVAPLADVNGDGRPDLVVGSPFYDVDAGAGTELAGRISVLSGASGTLIRNHDNPLGAAGENFGLAVSGAGDQSADGVEDYAGGDPGAGRVHLFNGASGAGLGSLSSATPGGEFGASLETSEDRSGDGRRDLWVGEPGAGRVRLVTAGGTDLLTINDPAPGGTPSILGFGFGLAPTPNLGGDAGSDLVIGEPSAASGPLANAGAAHLVLITANRPPVADAGADATAECAGPSGTGVTLDGSASSDPDGDTLSYTWRDASSAIIGTTAVVGVTLPLGSHTFSLTVADPYGGSATDTVTFVVADTVDPTLTVELTPNSLWPPNHKLVVVSATVTAMDTCAGSLSPVLVSITSSEPDNGSGDGDTADDIQGAAIGASDVTFSLRAERAGGGAGGRVYTVTYAATDQSGNTGEASATVVVPSSQAR